MDHVKPWGKGGETSWINAGLPCDECHKKKTADRLNWNDTG